jgi:hypothetical protein
MALKDAGMQIRAMVLEWPDVTAHPHRFGGVEYRLGARELGHVHGDHLLDIPFPTRVRDEIVDAGLAEPHHILPDTGWVSLYLRAGRCRARRRVAAALVRPGATQVVPGPGTRARS